MRAMTTASASASAPAPAFGRRQRLLLASVSALIAQACLGLIAYQAAPALSVIDGARLLGYGSIEVLATIVGVGVCLHFLHPELPRAHKLIGAVLIGSVLGVGTTGLETVEGVESFAMVALQRVGSMLGTLSTVCFGLAVVSTGPRARACASRPR